MHSQTIFNFKIREGLVILQDTPFEDESHVGGFKATASNAGFLEG